MILRVAIQMDDIASIDPRLETTFLLGTEAQARGYKLWHYTPDKLSWLDGKVIARAQPLTLRTNPNDYYTLGKEEALDLSTMDVVWLRQNPPFNMGYVSTTYLLEKLHPKTLVVNNPSAVRDLPEKLFPTLAGKFMPPTLISADAQAIHAFRKREKDIVLKPLCGHSGHSVFHIKPSDVKFDVLLKKILGKNPEPWVAQRYLPEMKKGERRLILIDGKLAVTLGRIPAPGAVAADIHTGAKYIKAKPTRRDLDICKVIGPLLKKRGLIFAGLDVIGEYLTEVNITSPGSLAGANKIYGINLEADIWDAVERKL